MQGKAEIRETVAGYAAAILRGEEVSLYSHGNTRRITAMIVF